MKYSIDSQLKVKMWKLLILLTDWDVENQVQVIDLIKESKNIVRVFSMRIGLNVSRSQIISTAKEERGKFYFLGVQDNMSQTVVQALKDSNEAYLHSLRSIVTLCQVFCSMQTHSIDSGSAN